MHHPLRLSLVSLLTLLLFSACTRLSDAPGLATLAEPGSSAFTLQDSKTGDVLPLVDGQTVETATPGVFGLQADTGQTTYFYLNGSYKRKESIAPYSLCGDGNGIAYGCGLGYGTYTVEARNGSGTVLKAITFTLAAGSGASTNENAYSGPRLLEANLAFDINTNAVYRNGKSMSAEAILHHRAVLGYITLGKSNPEWFMSTLVTASSGDSYQLRYLENSLHHLMDDYAVTGDPLILDHFALIARTLMANTTREWTVSSPQTINNRTYYAGTHRKLLYGYTDAKYVGTDVHPLEASHTPGVIAMLALPLEFNKAAKPEWKDAADDLYNFYTADWLAPWRKRPVQFTYNTVPFVKGLGSKETGSFLIFTHAFSLIFANRGETVEAANHLAAYNKALKEVFTATHTSYDAGGLYLQETAGTPAYVWAAGIARGTGTTVNGGSFWLYAQFLIGEMRHLYLFDAPGISEQDMKYFGATVAYNLFKVDVSSVTDKFSKTYTYEQVTRDGSPAGVYRPNGETASIRFNTYDRGARDPYRLLSYSLAGQLVFDDSGRVKTYFKKVYEISIASRERDSLKPRTASYNAAMVLDEGLRAGVTR